MLLLPQIAADRDQVDIVLIGKPEATAKRVRKLPSPSASRLGRHPDKWTVEVDVCKVEDSHY